MRQRPAARLLVLDPQGRLLLFRFVHTQDALAGSEHWSTPGGGVEDGESFEQAAVRELQEETGLRIDDPGPQVGRRVFPLTLPDGEVVEADERFFLVRVDDCTVMQHGRTEQENDVIREHRWWTMEALRSTDETVWPTNIAQLISGHLRHP